MLERVDAGQIVAVARSPEKAADLAAKGIIVRQGDYADYDSLVSAFDGADVWMFISNSNVANRVSEHTPAIPLLNWPARQ